MYTKILFFFRNVRPAAMPPPPLPYPPTQKQYKKGTADLKYNQVRSCIPEVNSNKDLQTGSRIKYGHAD